MTTGNEVLKLLKSKNREDRLDAARKYPAIVTSSHEEICRAALEIVSAYDLEEALNSQENANSVMSKDLEAKLFKTLHSHSSLPSGVAPKVKTLEISDTGEIIKRPGRPSAEAKRILEEHARVQEVRHDPVEEREVFDMVKSYKASTSSDADDDDEDFTWKR